jgi:hypothetical protein
MKLAIFVSMILVTLFPPPFAAQDSTAQGPGAAQKAVAPVKAAGQTLEEEDILIDETEARKTVQKAPETSPNQQSVSSTADSAQAAPKNAADSSQPSAAQKPDSAKVASSADSGAAPAAKQSDSVKAPATVESIRSINFAKNLKDYRSPKLAMFMSLLVPGLGQAYVKQYYKTGIFLALEATVIGFSAAFNSKGKQQYDAAKSIADRNFEFERMKAYYDGLRGFIAAGAGLPQSETITDSAAEARIWEIYMDSALVSFTNANKQKSQEFYRTIEANSFVQGWKDCQPDPSFLFGTDSAAFAGGFKYRKLDSLRYKVSRIDSVTGKVADGDSIIFGYSKKQLEFQNTMSRSNSYYKTARNILFSMVFNHILSAVDALISAKAYNDALIGKESVWRHISVEQHMVDAGGGAGSATGCALTFRF